MLWSDDDDDDIIADSIEWSKISVWSTVQTIWPDKRITHTSHDETQESSSVLDS